MLVSLLAGLAHAGLMAVAFAPVEYGWAALVAIVPLVWVAVGMTRERGADRASRVSERSDGRDGEDDASNASDASATSRLRERLYAGRFRKRDAMMVGLGASAFYWWQQQWVMDISAAGYVPLVLYMSIYPGLFVWLLSRLHGRFPRVPLAVLVPIVWTGLEWIRGEVVWDGYAWFLLGHPLIDTPIAWAGSVVGAYGVGALVAASIGSVWERWALSSTVRIGGIRRLAGRVLSFAWIVIVLGWLNENVTTYANFSITMGIVQTNLPQSNKIGWSAEQRGRDFERFMDLTRLATDGAKKPLVVLWPETMFPGYFLEPLAVRTSDGQTERRVTRFTEELLALQFELGVPMLVGALGTQNLRLEPGPDGGRVAFDGRFNSVFRIEGGEVDRKRYDKIRLTPFGETMPYISMWPWLEKKLLSVGAAGMSFDLGKGSEAAAAFFDFAAQDFANKPATVRVITPICFEVTEAGLCRRLVRAAAAPGVYPVLANVTNDGWFGRWDSGRRQHLLAARWRSLELGVPVVRAANTGISSVSSPKMGPRLEEIACGPRSDGVLQARVVLTGGTTIYREIGDLCWVFPLALGGLVILAIVRRMPNNLGGGSGTETAKAA